jgi:hypothetical protein
MAQGKVTASTLNLRTAPNIGSSVLASLPTGELLIFSVLLQEALTP